MSVIGRASAYLRVLKKALNEKRQQRALKKFEKYFYKNRKFKPKGKIISSDVFKKRRFKQIVRGSPELTKKSIQGYYIDDSLHWKNLAKKNKIMNSRYNWIKRKAINLFKGNLS